jgi:trigger factor
MVLLQHTSESAPPPYRRELRGDYGGGRRGAPLSGEEPFARLGTFAMLSAPSAAGVSARSNSKVSIIMQVSVVDAGKLRKQLTISYSKDEVQSRRAQVLKQLAGEVKLNGFRPGKGASGILEKRYGAAATAHTEERLGDEAFSQALKEKNLAPIGQVKSESISRDNGFQVVVSFEVKPTIALPEVSSLTVTNATVAIGDSDINEQLTALAKRAGTLSPLAEGETIHEDDSITVSGNVTVDGVEARKLHDFNHLVGGYPFFGKAPAEVVEALKGKKAGDLVTFTATLPKSFTPAEYAEKEATVAVTIQVAQRLRAATLDDEFAKRIGAESLEKLKMLLTVRMQAGKENEARGKQVAELTEQLLSKVSVELPEELLAATVKDAEEAATKRAEGQGKKGDELTAAKTEAVAEATKGLTRFLILDALATKLGVEVTNEDLSDQIQMAAQQTGRRPEEIAKQLRESGRAQQVAMEIREAKAVESLLDLVLGKTENVAKG